jgi:hypothetical protein
MDRGKGELRAGEEVLIWDKGRRDIVEDGSGETEWAAGEGEAVWVGEVIGVEVAIIIWAGARWRATGVDRMCGEQIREWQVGWMVVNKIDRNEKFEFR